MRDPLFEGILQGFISEFSKLAAVSEEELAEHIQRLEKLEQDKPDARQLQRYALIGGALTPVASTLEKLVSGEPILSREPVLPGAPPGRFLPGKTLRMQAGRAVGGAIGAGVIPLVRHGLDRAAERRALRKKIQEIEMGEAPSAAPPPVPTPAPELVKAATSLTADAHTSPQGRLASARRVGLPRITEPEGPSLAALSKPHGFGRAAPGTVFGP